MKEINFRNDILPLKNQLYRLALRITLNPAEAEDVVQETLIRIWNRRDQWETYDSVEALCFKICRNLALDANKRKDNQTSSLMEVTLEQSDPSDPQKQLLQSERLAEVKRIIDALPEKQKSCIQLREFEGFAYKKIAETIGISEEQVKICIYRARQTIKSQFKKFEDYGL